MTKVVNKHGLATVLGRAMMDPNFAIQAFQVGKRQAEREAAAIQAAWNF